VKQIKVKATRSGNILDPIFTNAPDCYKCINHQVLGSDHETVIATPIANIYKQQQPKHQKIVTRGGKIADSIEQIGNIEWDDLINELQNYFTTIKRMTIKNGS
jgi:hypothetical protein